MEASTLEHCANCYQSIDQHKKVKRAFECATCGMLAVECGLCAALLRERGIAGVDRCGRCNLEEEAAT